MPSTHTLQRGTGAAASVEGVTRGTNLSRTRQGDCQSKLLLRVQAALDKPLPMCSWQWGGRERQEHCAVVCLSAVHLVQHYFGIKGCKSLAIYFKELLLWRW